MSLCHDLTVQTENQKELYFIYSCIYLLIGCTLQLEGSQFHEQELAPGLAVKALPRDHPGIPINFLTKSFETVYSSKAQ